MRRTNGLETGRITRGTTATTARALYFSVLRNNDFTFVDLVDDVVGIASLDGASDGLRGSENLLHGSFQLTGHRTGSHLPGDVHNCVQGQVTGVLDILHLFWKGIVLDRIHHLR